MAEIRRFFCFLLIFSILFPLLPLFAAAQAPVVIEEAALPGPVVLDEPMPAAQPYNPPTEETEPPEPSIPEDAPLSGACGENLTWELDPASGTLTIRGSGPMTNFPYNGQPWNAASGGIQTVILEDGITSIGTYAFARHKVLRSVSIPDSVTEIGKFAFYICPALSEFSLPEGLTAIANGTFYGCAALTSVTIPEGVASIGSDAFEKCTALTAVTLPSTLTTIGNTAFAGCTNLSAIPLPSGLTKLGGGSFYECTALTTLTLPAGLTEIADHTFYGCHNLQSICIPSQVTAIGYAAFYGCGSLSQISFTGSSPAIDDQAFSNVTAKAFYPGDDASWTDGVQMGYGGTLTWSPLLHPIVGNQPATGYPQLKWTHNPDALSYEIYRALSPEGKFYWMRTNTGSLYTNKTAKAGKTYYYKIKVNFRNGCSACSAVIPCTGRLPRPNVSVSNDPVTGKIQVSWTAVEGAQEYAVYRAASQYSGYSKILTTKDTAFTDTASLPGKTWYYSVQAIHADSNTNSADSVIRSRMGDLPQPKVTAGNVAATGKIRLSWPAIDGAAKYEVWRSATGKTGSFVRIKTVTANSFTATLTDAGEAYYYKVKAIHTNSNANSVWSAVHFRTCDLAQPLASISLNAQGKPKLTWKAVPGAEKYEIYRSFTKNGTYQKVFTTTLNRFTATGAPSGTTIYYKVKALCSVPNAASALSPIVSIRTK